MSTEMADAVVGRIMMSMVGAAAADIITIDCKLKKLRFVISDGLRLKCISRFAR